jgi:hypothetical protein
LRIPVNWYRGHRDLPIVLLGDGTILPAPAMRILSDILSAGVDILDPTAMVVITIDPIFRATPF